MRDKIMNILKNVRPDADFDTSDDFVSDGFLDSFDVISLVSELDSSFGISIDGAKITPENFSTLEKIADLVRENGGA
ncbi:acyl carrier protein [Aurantimicrobium minutum]|uniref:acyl carrier protein n=1 Tax=Aurantimicrobium minutum TaxID=708131 RepID=UPI002406108D|nr:acyl carrier protein [Aurantimicrobium minutum]MDF9810745.1 acyl carrier protein [Aurantimicrobium minutum]